MLNEEAEIKEALIPGVLSDRKNCIVYYSTTLAVFITLLLLLVITIITAATVSDVQKTASETRILVKDMNTLMPQAKMGLKILDVLCSDRNFTTFYPKYADVIC